MVRKDAYHCFLASDKHQLEFCLPLYILIIHTLKIFEDILLILGHSSNSFFRQTPKVNKIFHFCLNLGSFPENWRKKNAKKKKGGATDILYDLTTMMIVLFSISWKDKLKIYVKKMPIFYSPYGANWIALCNFQSSCFDNKVCLSKLPE